LLIAKSLVFSTFIKYRHIAFFVNASAAAGCVRRFYYGLGMPSPYILECCPILGMRFLNNKLGSTLLFLRAGMEVRPYTIIILRAAKDFLARLPPDKNERSFGLHPQR